MPESRPPISGEAQDRMQQIVDGAWTEYEVALKSNAPDGRMLAYHARMRLTSVLAMGVLAGIIYPLT